MIPTLATPRLVLRPMRPGDWTAYAAEAAAALRGWAFAQGLPALVSYIDSANAPSIRLAERQGAARDTGAVPQDPGDIVFRHPAGRP
ncbi:MAG: GNAT family N-acetyltransferase [Gemmobacter sp.]